MKCPECENIESTVVDSRYVQSRSVVRRRRKCLSCEHAWTTYELSAEGSALTHGIDTLQAITAIDEAMQELSKARRKLDQPQPADFRRARPGHGISTTSCESEVG